MSGPDAAATVDGAPRRVCVVSENNPYARHGGNTQYLDSVVAALGKAGAALHLLALRGGPRLHQLRMPSGALPAFAHRYRSVTIRRALWRGPHLYAVRPEHLIHRAVRALRGGPQAADAPYSWLPPADADAVAWAGRRMTVLAPDMVLANYFNAAAAFAVAPPSALRVVLVHDVMALRRESFAAAGAVFDLGDEAVARETAAFRSADLCLAIKEREAAHIRSVAPDAMAAVAPYAVDLPDITTATPRPPVALFVGSVNAANVDGLAWLLREIWPRVTAARADARLRVIGRMCESVEGPWPAGAETVGFAPDLATEYAGAAVTLTPLRFGSGVKIKLIEGLAHGLPGVATTVGADGIDPVHSTGVLQVADDAAGFAAAILKALADPDAAATRAAARSFAAARHGHEAAGRVLLAALAAARQERHRPG